MTPDTKQGIERFLRRAIFDDAPTRLIRRVELHHHPKNAHASLVWRKEWTDDEWETLLGRGEKKLAERLLEQCEGLTNFVSQMIIDDASQMRGRQRYRVVAIDEGGERVGRHFVTVDGIDDEYHDDIDEIDPTLRGLLKQQMQINAKLVAASQMGYAQIIATQQRMLDRSQEHVEKLIDQRLESFETIEEAISLRHERQLEAEQVRADAEIKGKAVDSLKLLGPAVLNRLNGAAPSSPATDPKALLVDELLKSITPEQANALASAGILKPDQLIAVMELIRENTNSDNSGGTNGAA